MMALSNGASDGKRRVLSPVLGLLPYVVFAIGIALAPRFVGDSSIATLIYIGINAILCIGLNMLMGYAGQVSLGHAAFFGLGAYSSAILTVRPIQGPIIPGFAAGVGLLAALVVLISVTRVRGWKFAVGALALLLLTLFGSHARLSGVIPIVAALVVCSAVMAALGLWLRIGWSKCMYSGLTLVVVTVLGAWFLRRVLAAGGTNPWIGIVAGVVLTGLIAYLVGNQVLRLRGHYLAMATLGFGIIVEIVFRQWTDVTGGSSDGIFGIPSIPITSHDSLLASGLGWLNGAALTPQREYFYLVWAVVFVALVVSVNIVRSRVGRAMRAVHGSEVAAESLGVDTERYKIQVFVFSAVLGSIAGSLHAHNAGIGYINPSEFSFMVSVQLLVMVVVGGMASVWGALLGAFVIQLLKNWMLDLDKAHHVVFGIVLKGLDPIVFGATLILVMILLPQGLVRGIADSVAASVRAATRTKKRETESAVGRTD